MFKDDALIAILSAIVLMVAVGTVIQRSDGAAELWSGKEQPAEQATELRALIEDHAVIPVNEVSTLNVLANDVGVTPEMAEGLEVLNAPDCALMSVMDGAIQFLPQVGCEGSHTLSYTVPGLQTGSAASVFVIVEAGEDSQAADGDAAEQKTSRVVASSPSTPQIAYNPSFEPSDEESDALPEAEEDTQPVTIQAADEETLALLGEDTQTQTQQDTLGTAPDSDGVSLDQAVLVTEASEVLQASPSTGEQQPKIMPVPVRRAEPEPTASVAPEVDPVLALGSSDLQPAIPDGLIALADSLSASLQSSDEASLPRWSAPEAQDVVLQDDGGFLIAVVEAREPVSQAPIELSIARQDDKNISLGATSGAGDLLVAAMVPQSSSEAPTGLGQALAIIPQDTDQPEPSLGPRPSDAQAPVQEANLAPAEGISPLVAPIPSTRRSVPVENQPAPAVSTEPCEAPPAMTIDVRRAGQTVVSVLASCQAGTIAELQYSGLKLAVPLDAEGRGTVLALGFESTSPAFLTFSNGDKIDFDLPFKGVNRVSRIAVVWDLPVSLELNALEFGAGAGSAGHVRPENPRNFEQIRPTGGGYLSSYRSAYGIGQNVEIYSHWSHRAGQTGVVKMMIDFASRNRDRLAGTCGNGVYATPQFLIIRSVEGRLERPILRKLAALECSSVTQETGDKRLISGAVGDLLVTRK